jgi:type I restriction enzyme M protein
MLDTATKRRIDTARDILVGKVPDPKSQVEQITIALIYKFMDDMDAEAEELGGKRSFFAGEFGKYGWAKLMRSGLGGHETLGLYAEAITRMPENPGVPPLFRDIFKNAYLPYRDPETLRAFLKIIDEFEYDHSERLGDAFEYLLSVLGSQGDAGQFRTPRHIIDFIVDIVDPTKGDTILDPACGTAGFLISAWKHILEANRDERGESTLTPDERERLATGIRGYDISPDMVRLSLANMYLHGFADPHIAEYDTLTSDERWNDFADVILANPPFMSPKGGIKPHNRFGVQSNRSEVLFVDYMAEHLTPNGRAGIIVPEGVIFQSGKAYKTLRKMLVDKYLVAVISLPAGVFNPYSGVKTSILILDRLGAKANDTIGFFKVANDGFGLGAQRRETGGSELPEILAEIAKYRANGEEAWEGRFGRAVSKAEIAADGEYNLSGERYVSRIERVARYPILPIDNVVTLDFGERITKHKHEGTMYPVYGGGGESFRTDRSNRNDRIVISRFAMSPECVRRVKGPFFLLDSGFTYSVRAEVADTVLQEYLDALFLSIQPRIYACARGHAQKNIDTKEFRRIEIPIPPCEAQREIVAEIESYQKIIDGARSVVENYRPYIAVVPEWPFEQVQSVVSTITPPVKLQTTAFGAEGHFPIIDQSQNEIAGWTNDETALVDAGDGLVIFGDHTCAIKFVSERFAQGADGIKILKPGPLLLPKFLFFYLQANPIEQDGYKRHFGKLKESDIPLPPLETQREIVAELETERALVEANGELIARMEKKIEATIARVWGAAESPEPERTAIE